MKQLFQQAELREYLKHAIKEIPLIVISILLAFQLDNLKAQQAQNTEEAAIIRSISQDFDKNILELKKTIAKQQLTIRYSKRLIALFGKENLPSVDSLLLYKDKGSNSWWRAELTNGAYISMVNSGKPDLIKNDSLKKELAHFSADLEAGFEDESEEMESLFRMYNISYEYEYNLLTSKKQEYYNVKVPEEQALNSMKTLLRNKSFIGALINKTNIEKARLAYQNKLLTHALRIDHICKHYKP